jgi:hypothetical protein
MVLAMPTPADFRRVSGCFWRGFLKSALIKL